MTVPTERRRIRLHVETMEERLNPTVVAIFGHDSRIQLPNEMLTNPINSLGSIAPWAAIGHLTSEFISQTDNKRYGSGGTAWLIGPNLALTAAHCLYGRDNSGRVYSSDLSTIRIHFGRNGSRAGIVATAKRYEIPPAFKSQLGTFIPGGQSKISDRGADYALIVLNENVGNATRTWFAPVTVGDLKGYLGGSGLSSAGYPGDKITSAGATMWVTHGPVDRVSGNQMTFAPRDYVANNPYSVNNPNYVFLRKNPNESDAAFAQRQAQYKAISGFDIVGGQSGSPVFSSEFADPEWLNGVRPPNGYRRYYAFGVLNTGGSNGAGASHFTTNEINQLNAWINAGTPYRNGVVDPPSIGGTSAAILTDWESLYGGDFYESPSTPLQVGDRFWTNLIVVNRGLSTASNVRVRYYISSDDQITPNDWLIYTSQPTNTLAPGGNVADATYANGQPQMRVPMNLPPGNYRLGWIIETPFAANQENIGVFDDPFIVRRTPTLVPESGAGQAATVDESFANTITARITQPNGSPITNYSITITLPSSGPSGTFAGGSRTFTTTTDADGRFTIPAPRANTVAGAWALQVTGADGLNAAISLINRAASPASIEMISGNLQAVAVEADYLAPVVRVRDRFGNPVVNAGVVFTVSGANFAHWNQASALGISTGDDGIARANGLKAGTRAGAFTITASVAGVSTPARFELETLAGSSAGLSIISGNGQSVGVEQNATAPLVIGLVDRFGNRTRQAGITVLFFQPGTAIPVTFLDSQERSSDLNGLASMRIQTGTQGGRTIITARTFFNNLVQSIDFEVNIIGTAATSMTVHAWGQRRTVAGGTFDDITFVSVRDAFNNPVPNLPITFTAPTSGATGTYQGQSTWTLNSDASGTVYFRDFRASTQPGTFDLSISAPGVAMQTLAHTIVIGEAARVEWHSGVSSRSLQLLTDYDDLFTVRAVDAAGNPVVGANIIFDIPVDVYGPIARFANGQQRITVTSDSNGLATLPRLTTSQYAGGYRINAGLANGPVDEYLTATNLPGAANRFVPPSNTVGFVDRSEALRFRITDRYGNYLMSVPPITATLRIIPGPSASASFAGQSSITAVLEEDFGSWVAPIMQRNTRAGTFQVEISAAGMQTETFTLINRADKNDRLTPLAGTPREISAGVTIPTLLYRLEDAYGNAKPNNWLRFTATQGRFANGATTFETSSDANGIITIPNYTAGTAIGLEYIEVTDLTEPTLLPSLGFRTVAGTPTRIVPGAGLRLPVGTTVTNVGGLGAVVYDAFGNMVEAPTITLTIVSGVATGSFNGSPSITITNGNVPSFTTGQRVGTYQVLYSIGGRVLGSTTIENLVGTAARLEIIEGADQTAVAGKVYARPMLVRVVDAFGNPVPNQDVTFTIRNTEVRGHFGGALTITVRSNSQGIATAPTLTAGTDAYRQQFTSADTADRLGLNDYLVSAGIDGQQVSIRQRVLADAATQIRHLSGDGTILRPGGSTTLRVTVVDRYGNPVPAGTIVTFSVATGFGTFANGQTTISMATNARSEVGVTLRAGTRAGSHTAYAAVSGASARLAFRVVNDFPPPPPGASQANPLPLGTLPVGRLTIPATTVNANASLWYQINVPNVAGVSNGTVTLTPLSSPTSFKVHVLAKDRNGVWQVVAWGPANTAVRLPTNGTYLIRVVNSASTALRFSMALNLSGPTI